ncbi:phosphoglycerate mutase family protein [Planctobacterium marinum]|uniref:phosphoglycerate mutase family protein n=1 Tax=Planctobacterium marinum TaxID=1631968 RepID=UPI001E4097E8|nr:phosphoglycerate mutase family protein [Planctobacterium marinum]MCC2607674.1 histidine phosphatase family protein [Planctobacterium marinum]
MTNDKNKIFPIFRLRFFSLFLLFWLTNSVAQTPPDADLWLVRHMEKQRDGSKDPQLTEKGWNQANKLKDLLLDKGIQAVYATNYQRTQQTAEPIAKALGLDVIQYDPKNLKDFAEKLKASGQKALVVGHSNTTPELAFHLTGLSQKDIDEDEYNRTLFSIYLNSELKMSLGAVDMQQEYKKPALAKIRVDQQKIHSFESHFDMLFSEQKVGTARQKILLQDNQIRLTEVTKVKKFNVDATISATAETDNLLPVTLRLIGSMGTAADINLRWQDYSPDGELKQVTGHSEIARPVYKVQGRQQIDNRTGLSSVERTTAIMTVPFFANDKAFSFEWFNGYDGHETRIQYIPMGKETVTVPAGTFETRKVKLSGGAPSQIFYISTEDKPKVVKIEVLHMPWVYELTQYTNLSDSPPEN